MLIGTMQPIGIFFLTIVLVIAVAQADPSNRKVVVCPVAIKMKQSPNIIADKIDEIDWNLCTHIVHGSWGEATYDTWTYQNEENSTRIHPNLDQLVDLRKKFPHLKIFANFYAHNIETAADGNHNQEIVQKYYNFIKDNEYDGLNFYFDTTQDKPILKPEYEKVISFLTDLKVKLDQNDLKLTATISGKESFNFQYYDLGALSTLVELMNIVQSHSDFFLNFDLALKLRGISRAQLNIDSVIEQKLAPEKIILGLSFNGIGVTKSKLWDSKIHEYGITCSMVDYTKSYDEDLPILKNKDNSSMIIIDDSRSIANKVRFALKRGLAGVAVHHSIDYDDVLGECKTDENTFEDFKPIEGVVLKFPKRDESTFPLLRTINEAIDVTKDEIEQEAIIQATPITTSDPTSGPTTNPTENPVSNPTSNPSQNNGNGAAYHLTINAHCLTFIIGSLISFLIY